jgi:hypothetical protein
VQPTKPIKLSAKRSASMDSIKLNGFGGQRACRETTSFAVFQELVITKVFFFLRKGGIVLKPLGSDIERIAYIPVTYMRLSHPKTCGKVKRGV